MKIIIPNVEIRGHEVKDSKTTDSKYIVIKFDTEEGDREEIIDRNMEHEPLYVRGAVGSFTATYKHGMSKSGSYANLSVVDFTPDAD